MAASSAASNACMAGSSTAGPSSWRSSTGEEYRPPHVTRLTRSRWTLASSNRPPGPGGQPPHRNRGRPMAAATRLTTSVLAQLAPAGGVVIAVPDAGSDPRFRAVRDAAATLAAGAGGRVLLFHAPPGQTDTGRRRWHLFVPGLRNTGTPAKPDAGRPAATLLEAEAAEIRARGVEVAVWLTSRPISAGMVEAVSVTGAAIVLMPA